MNRRRLIMTLIVALMATPMMADALPRAVMNQTAASETMVADLRVFANGTITNSIVKLEANRPYSLVIRGSYTEGVSSRASDAAFQTINSWGHQKLLRGSGLVIDNEPVANGFTDACPGLFCNQPNFRIDHKYVRQITGDGRALGMFILDQNYSDNQPGAYLTVQIWTVATVSWRMPIFDQTLPSIPVVTATVPSTRVPGTGGGANVTVTVPALNIPNIPAPQLVKVQVFHRKADGFVCLTVNGVSVPIFDCLPDPLRLAGSGGVPDQTVSIGGTDPLIRTDKVDLFALPSPCDLFFPDKKGCGADAFTIDATEHLRANIKPGSSLNLSIRWSADRSRLFQNRLDQTPFVQTETFAWAPFNYRDLNEYNWYTGRIANSVNLWNERKAYYFGTPDPVNNLDAVLTIAAVAPDGPDPDVSPDSIANFQVPLFGMGQILEAAFESKVAGQ